VHPRLFNNYAKIIIEKYPKAINIAKILHKIAKHAYLLNHNKAVLQLIKHNISEIKLGFIYEMKDLITNVSNLVIRDKMRPGEFATAQTTINTHITKDKIELHSFVQIAIYRLRRIARIQYLGYVSRILSRSKTLDREGKHYQDNYILDQTSIDAILDYMSRYNKILLEMERHFDEKK